MVGLANRDPKTLALFVWIYCLLWWFVQDFFKVLMYWYLKRHNIFGINDSLKLSEGFSDPNVVHDDLSRPLLLGLEEVTPAVRNALHQSHHVHLPPQSSSRPGSRQPSVEVLRPPTMHRIPTGGYH